jgi:hypothetical protein
METFMDVYKPFHEVKSPYMSILGANWQATKYWQTLPDGSMVVVCEASAREYELVTSGLRFMRGGDEARTYNQLIKPAWAELVENKRLQVDEAHETLRAKIFMPNTILVTKLVPKQGSDRGKEKAYNVASSAIAWCDKATTDIASECYSMPLPNTWALPFGGQSGRPGKICWGDSLRGLEFQPETLSVLFERFYNSKFNMDLTNWLFFGKSLPCYVKGPDYKKEDPLGKRLTYDYLKKCEQEGATYEHGQYITIQKFTVGSLVKFVGGQNDY